MGKYNINVNKRMISSLIALGISLSPISISSEIISNSQINKNNIEVNNISIFNDINEETNQYGANQIVFKSQFNLLINDHLIWEELQKYF